MTGIKKPGRQSSKRNAKPKSAGHWIIIAGKKRCFHPCDSVFPVSPVPLCPLWLSALGSKTLRLLFITNNGVANNGVGHHRLPTLPPDGQNVDSSLIYWPLSEVSRVPNCALWSD